MQIDKTANNKHQRQLASGGVVNSNKKHVYVYPDPAHPDPNPNPNPIYTRTPARSVQTPADPTPPPPNIIIKTAAKKVRPHELRKAAPPRSHAAVPTAR